MVRTILAAAAAALALAGATAAQTEEEIREQLTAGSLPLEGAPLAVAGPYAVVSEPAAGAERNAVFRPASLNAFPATDRLPVVLWANGGCSANAGVHSGFLETLASYGFLVVTTAAPGEEYGQATTADLASGLDWAFAENEREDSPLAGKIDTDHVAALGVSCGGWMVLDLADDPRVDTIGVFGSGAGTSGACHFFWFKIRCPGEPGASVLAGIHGPALYLNGGELDHMTETSHDDFEAINHVPAFYGSRHNGGHFATYYHPGGGEFANVAVAWLKWQLKGDEEASHMFVGADCTLCTDPNWETASKGF